MSALVTTILHNARLAGRYSPVAYEGDLLYFSATRGQSAGQALVEAWRPHVAGVIDNYDIDCTHLDMTNPAPLADIGHRLAATLETLSTFTSAVHELE